MDKCDSLPTKDRMPCRRLQLWARGARLHVHSVDISKASSVRVLSVSWGKLNTTPVPGEPAVCRGGEAFLKRPHGIHDKPVVCDTVEGWWWLSC